MSEIYQNSSHFAYLTISGDVADEQPSAYVVTPDGDVALTVNGPETISGDERWTATIGLAHTQYAGEITVRWDFEIDSVAVTQLAYFDVVVPLVSIDQAREELEIPMDITDDDIVLAERRVRRMIEKYTGQQFAPTIETMIVRGRGDITIRTPKRLMEVTEFINYRTGIDWTGYEIRDDGWTLLRTIQYDTDEIISINGPIYDPYSWHIYQWASGVEYSVTGTWGWKRIPSPVKESALILIEQRLCPESQYRDSYLTSMKAADWSFDINPGAFNGTGNVVTDHLLAPFKVVYAAVV